MGRSRGIVLDANILIRLVLGHRVRALVLDHVDQVEFFAPAVCFDDARKYLPEILDRRGLEADVIQDSLEVLDGFAGVVRPLDESVYNSARADALARIASRDAADWPILAAALALGCPVWTEDQDFFGTGVPTWTTDRVELYLRNQQ